MVGSRWIGILEYWILEYLRSVYVPGFCSSVLLYIFPARFIHTFVGWNCEAKGRCT